jgi:hypothetical protein
MSLPAPGRSLCGRQETETEDQPSLAQSRHPIPIALPSRASTSRALNARFSRWPGDGVKDRDIKRDP